MIREFESNDRGQIVELGKILDREFSFDKIFEKESILVYETDKFIEGFVVYSKLYEVLDIMYIVVHESSRRRGVASSLISHLIENLNPDKIMLEVRSSNDEALAFYEKIGFKRLRVIKNYYDGGEDAIAMELEVL